MAAVSFLEYTKNLTSPVNQKVTNISDFNKMAILDKVSTLKIDNPKLTKKEIAKQVGVSDRTLLRYATELGENVYQKRNSKRFLEPSQCPNCEFIAKNKTGLQAHIRSKHLFKNRQNQKTSLTTVQEQNPDLRENKISNIIKRNKNKEKVGYGEEKQINAAGLVDEKELKSFILTNNDETKKGIKPEESK